MGRNGEAKQRGVQHGFHGRKDAKIPGRHVPGSARSVHPPVGGSPGIRGGGPVRGEPGRGQGHGRNPGAGPGLGGPGGQARGKPPYRLHWPTPGGVLFPARPVLADALARAIAKGPPGPPRIPVRRGPPPAHALFPGQRTRGDRRAGPFRESLPSPERRRQRIRPVPHQAERTAGGIQGSFRQRRKPGELAERLR